jgi:hypothetical protein
MPFEIFIFAAGELKFLDRYTLTMLSKSIVKSLSLLTFYIPLKIFILESGQQKFDKEIPFHLNFQ